jgi:hypothetical protein
MILIHFLFSAFTMWETETISPVLMVTNFKYQDWYLSNPRPHPD